MPDRIIRDELLRSHRYRRLTSDTTRLLFVHLLLCVDSLGNMEANTTAVGDALTRDIGDETAAKLLQELADCDLIRLYQVDGKAYLHIPRFRQRLRYIGGRHPLPPPHVECNEMKDLREKVGLQSGRGQTVVARREEKRSEVNPTRARQKPVDNSAALPRKPDGDKSPEPQNRKPEGREAVTVGATLGQWWRTSQGIEQRARLLGIQARAGESHDDLKQRVFAAEHGR